MRATGNYGELRVGYQRAARLGSWTLEATPSRAFAFSANITEKHDYWATQGPLDLVLVLGHTEWIWRGIVPTPLNEHVRCEVKERPIVSEHVK